MSLNASEQQALDSIEATLTSSDPKLASLLAIFARLASGEEMPVRERVRIHRRLQVTRGWQRKQRCSRPDKAGRHMHSGFRSLGWRRAGALMMCVLAFAGLIAVSVINSHANHGKKMRACTHGGMRRPCTKGAQPGRIGRATWPAGTSCLEGVGRQGRGETEHTSGY